MFGAGFLDQAVIEEFDFDALWAKDFSKVPKVCPSCGDNTYVDRGCYCSGEKVQSHSEPHRVDVPEFEPFLETPRSEWKANIEPNYARYREIVAQAFGAKPALVDFLYDFDWEEGSTESYEEAIDLLLQVPQVRQFADNILDARNPIQNLTNKVDRLTPSHAVDVASLNVDPHAKLNPLDYLCKDWFKKCKAYFKQHLTELQKDVAYSRIRVYTDDPKVRQSIEKGIGIPNVFFESSPEHANLYVYGPGQFFSNHAALIRNVWGLCYSGSYFDHKLPCDVDYSLGFVDLKVPFGFETKKRFIPAFQKFQFPTYSLVRSIIRQARTKYIPSGLFDEAWIEKVHDPVQNFWREHICWSPYGNNIGIISSYLSTKLKGLERPRSTEVREFFAPPTPHPCLTPTDRYYSENYQGSLPGEVDAVGLYHYFVFDYYPGDELCHWSLFVTKELTSLILKTNTRSLRRELNYPSNSPFSAHGWAVLDLSGRLCNPSVSFGPKARGLSLVDNLPSSIFDALDRLGHWAFRPDIQGNVTKSLEDAWIIADAYNSLWLCSDRGWFSPLARVSAAGRNNYRMFHLPEIGTYAFELWSHAVGYAALIDYKLNWIEIGLSLGKRQH